MEDKLKLSRIRRAIQKRNFLRLDRGVGSTIIRPHILFESKEGKVDVAGIYVSGETSQEQKEGWRQYEVRSLLSVEVFPETFTTTAPDYAPQSNQYHRVLCALPGSRAR